MIHFSSSLCRLTCAALLCGLVRSRHIKCNGTTFQEGNQVSFNYKDMQNRLPQKIEQGKTYTIQKITDQVVLLRDAGLQSVPCPINAFRGSHPAMVRRRTRARSSSNAGRSQTRRCRRKTTPRPRTFSVDARSNVSPTQARQEMQKIARQRANKHAPKSKSNLVRVLKPFARGEEDYVEVPCPGFFTPKDRALSTRSKQGYKDLHKQFTDAIRKKLGNRIVNEEMSPADADKALEKVLKAVLGDPEVWPIYSSSLDPKPSSIEDKLVQRNPGESIDDWAERCEFTNIKDAAEEIFIKKTKGKDKSEIPGIVRAVPALVKAQFGL